MRSGVDPLGDLGRLGNSRPGVHDRQLDSVNVTGSGSEIRESASVTSTWCIGPTRAVCTASQDR